MNESVPEEQLPTQEQPTLQHIEQAEGLTINDGVGPYPDGSVYAGLENERAQADAGDEDRAKAAQFREKATQADNMPFGDGDFLRRDAEARDSRANLKEDWAAVLHEHPISDAYREAHPGVKFEALDLFQLQEMRDQDLGWAAINKRALVEQLPGDALTGNLKNAAPTRTYEDMVKQYAPQEEAQANIEQWRALKANPDTTLGQLKALYDESYTRYWIDPYTNRAAIEGAVLDDVRSGRASQ